MRAIILLALLAVAVPIPAGADGDVDRSAEGQGAVAIYRGNSANRPSAVMIHRGSAIQPAYLSAPASSDVTQAIGGRRIWFVNRARDQLASCEAINTLNVGDRRIRCTRAPLSD